MSRMRKAWWDRMPYGGSTPEEDAKIERCVEQLMKSGKDKVSAIRICKASVLKGKKPRRVKKES